MRALLFALALPGMAAAQDNQCQTHDGQTICECATLAPDMRICGSWDSGWINLPAPDGVLALLQGEGHGIATIIGPDLDTLSLPDTKARYLAAFPEFVDVRDLAPVTVDGFDVISFTGTSTRNPRRASPIAVTMLAGDAGTFMVETVFPNAFGLPKNAVLSAEMQASHDSLFALIEMTGE